MSFARHGRVGSAPPPRTIRARMAGAGLAMTWGARP
jgi:hypothetical protein